MKKNYLFGLLSLFTLLFAASCQEEDVFGGASMADTEEVTFTVNTQQVATRADLAGKGNAANKLYYGVYEATAVDADGNGTAWQLISALSALTDDYKTDNNITLCAVPAGISSNNVEVKIKLAKQKLYSVIFWAQSNAPMCTVNWSDRTMTVKTDVVANTEDNDVFYGYEESVKLDGKISRIVNLYRPFAQLNIGTSIADFDDAAKAKLDVAQSQVVVKGVPNKLDLATGRATGEVDKTYEFANIPDKDVYNFPVDANKYRYLALAYVLVDNDEDKKMLVDVDFACKEATGTGNDTYNRTFTAVPVQLNYRTNIYGNLLSGEGEFDVELQPGLGDDGHDIYNVTVDGVSYDNFAEAVAKALELNKPVDFVESVAIDADATITIPEGKTLTLNLNGNTLSGVTDDADKNDDGQLTSADNEVMFDVRGTMNVNDGIITIKHESDNFGWNACTEIFYVGFNGTLNVNDATLENYGGSDMAYAIDMVNADGNGTGITVNVQNSTIKSSYIPVRVFNNGKGMNNVTIKKSTLEGKSRAFWVHIYSSKDNGNKGVKDATLNIDIFNPASENIFIATNPDLIIEYGFDDEINLNEFGGQIIKDQNGNAVKGIGIMEQDAEGNPTVYGVYSAEGFNYIMEEFNSSTTGLSGVTIELIGDIDLSQIAMFTRSEASNWTPIGTAENPFKGVFDGKGCTIKNLNIVETEAKEGKAFIGFFGYAKDATIKNVTFENVNINIPCLDIDHSQGHIGAVAGSLEGTSTIENVTVKGDIKVYSTQDANGASRVAVVAGGNSYGNVTMKNVHVIANEGSYLIANNNTGALAGQLQGKCSFENCSSNINITVNKFFAGGIIGLTAGDSKFVDCHTTGNVAVVAGREGRAHDQYRVGGIAGGWADNTKTPCVLTNCSYKGVISGMNSDGSVADPLDYDGYVGRGYTLAGCQGSTVKIDNKSFIQKYNDVNNAGIYTVKINDLNLVANADDLVAFLEANEGVMFTNNIKIDPANMSNAYGTTGINVTQGQTIDGGGHILDIKGAGGTWDSGINTTGGLIKDLTVTGSFRGIFINHNSTYSEKVVLENVTIDGTTYTISCDQGLNQGFEATNSTFKGWTSYAATLGNAKFTNCYFGEGSGYAYCRPYAPTEFVGCEFEAGFTVDPIADVTFESCTLGGVALTVENLATLVSNTAKATIK